MPYDGPWTGRARATDEWLSQHKVGSSALKQVVSATTASLVSTFAGFPLDSLKSRLQSSRENLSIPRLAAEVVREEGVGGLWRGFPLPLITISIVRTISFTIYTSTKRILNSVPGPSAVASSDVALTSMLAGGASGAVVCVGSAPFELVKVRRQLEYQIYRDSHPELFRPNPPPSAGTSLPTNPTPAPRPAPFVPPTTLQAVRLIVTSSGYRGLYTGWRLHFIRDTLGTALYFAEYDVMRYYLGRSRTKGAGGQGEMGSGDVQGDVPDWARAWLPKQIIPFLCGSLAGVSSWALIYPVDAIKTKAQQRALSGLEPRTPLYQLRRLVRGVDKDNPKPWLTGIARLYRGLGVSMIRSMLTHGLLWTIVDAAGSWIETKPFTRLATSSSSSTSSSSATGSDELK
ncbi:hypothetical protein I316_02274 [Kwoniella heveanensis BCC8398]|uniref:Solute carrier family 25 (Mitochondrial carnitine/acylcarnitine transporter), member 20/29 n=1 Tax=Kwoniella heveanensis BCC8398 TaxID=1296120 RepID=A0A1B9GXM7_9TREE|nr:hypothetical protein I316_02274 [Kwoniella heveanensis BCC8398]